MRSLALTLLVPGYAQARNGQSRKAAAVAACSFLLLVLAAATPWLHSFPGLLTFLGAVLAGAGYCVWDGRRRRPASPARVPARLATALAVPVWALLLAIVLFPARVAGIRAYRLPAGHTSSAPTLLPGDRLLADMRPRASARGDLVLCRAPEGPPCAWVRRVVAIEGDVVEAGPEGVRVNGRLMAPGTARPYGPVTVGSGECFLLGEDLARCRDSRHFGPVPIGAIIGHPLYVFWADAWERIGTNLR